MTKVIAFQGAHGANSEIACSYFCSESETVPCETFEDTFDTLLEGRANLAMIPIENSQAGRVADVHNLLPESRLSIVAEHYQPIYHHLLALPNVPFSNIKQIRSHTMALAQCREKLRKWGVSCHVSADTAGAARDLVLSQDPTVAVVATRLAAEIYKLNILEENIEDSSDNMTRFVVLSRQEDWPSINVKSMTTIIFCLKSLPSALYKCLGDLRRIKLMLLKLRVTYLGVTLMQHSFIWTLRGILILKMLPLPLTNCGIFLRICALLACTPNHHTVKVCAKLKRRGEGGVHVLRGKLTSMGALFARSDKNPR